MKSKRDSAQKNRRRFTAMVTVLSLLLLLMISLTIAYFTDQRIVLNILGIGAGSDGGGGEVSTVKIKLTEPGFAATDNVVKELMNPGEADEYAKLELYNILPGQKINKDPTITNIGAEPVYVRVKFVHKVYDETLQTWTSTPVKFTESPYSILGAEVDSTKWTYKNDGYWYLNAALGTEDANKTATVLKNRASGQDPAYTMALPAALDNTTASGLIGLFNLEVVAEAIQSRGFTPDMNEDDPWTMEDGTTPVTIIPAIRG